MKTAVPHRCTACGHDWVSRLPRAPKVCPRCKSYKWNGMVDQRNADYRRASVRGRAQSVRQRHAMKVKA